MLEITPQICLIFLAIALSARHCHVHKKQTVLGPSDIHDGLNKLQYIKRHEQHAKKVVSDSQGQVDFGIGLVIFVLNLPNGQVLFFGEIQIKEGL